MVRSSVSCGCADLTIARALLQKHSYLWFRAIISLEFFHNVRAGAKCHKIHDTLAWAFAVQTRWSVISHSVCESTTANQQILFKGYSSVDIRTHWQRGHWSVWPSENGGVSVLEGLSTVCKTNLFGNDWRTVTVIINISV